MIAYQVTKVSAFNKIDPRPLNPTSTNEATGTAITPMGDPGGVAAHLGSQALMKRFGLLQNVPLVVKKKWRVNPYLRKVGYLLTIHTVLQL